MRAEFEEEPDDEPEAPTAEAATSTILPSVGAPAREFEYRTEAITPAEIVDGQTLAGRLNTASAEGWDLVEIVGTGERCAILLRRPKPAERTNRPVGFAPPAR